jgi:hypothetical protein
MLHVHACLTIQVQSNKLVTCTTITRDINNLTADTEAKCPRQEKRGKALHRSYQVDFDNT